MRGRDPDIAGLRILLTSDAVGGVFSYSATLARELCGAGAHVTLVLQGPPASSSQRAQLDGVAGLYVIHTDLQLEWLDPDGADAARSRRALADIAADVRPDIGHLCGYRDALADFAAPTVVVAHSCVPTWWQACRSGVPDASWDIYTRNVRAGLNAADAWIAPSHSHRDIIETLHAPCTRGHVVHNGTAPTGAGPSDRPLILAAGRQWDEAKDFPTLLRAADAIEWPVQVAGPRSRDDTDAAIEINAGVEHLGALSREQLLRQMATAKIFVSPAVYEPFGLSVLEAAASGCALVLSDIPSFRELWDDAALFFSARDAAGLARQVNRLAQDDELRAELRARSLERARRYSAARMMTETAQVYAATLGMKSARAAAPTGEAVPA